MSRNERFPHTSTLDVVQEGGDIAPSIHVASAAELGRDEGELHLGRAYLVPRAQGEPTIMYESPREVWQEDKEGELKVNPDFMELVGAEPEDVLMDGRMMSTLPSMVVSREDYTDDKQRKYAESKGVHYGQLIEHLPEDSRAIEAVFARMSNPERPASRLKIIGKGLLEVVKREQ